MQNRNNLNLSNCDNTGASCVVWNLPDIPCLNIKTGDTLDLLTFAIVRKLCEREDEFDLGSITLSELVERFNITEPSDKTIHTLLQLLVDNDVRIHKLFTALRDSIPGAVGGMVLDLKCFKQLDSYGNQVPYDEQTVLQDLIDEACSIRDEFEDLKEIVDSLDDGGGGIYIEPPINGFCLGSDKRGFTFVSHFASEFCAYRGKIGEAGAIDIAIGKQSGTELEDSGWNVRFVDNPNFEKSPTTLAQSEGNQWIAINNLNTRVESLEACACKVTCKDLTVGFGVLNTDSGIMLEFAPQYGNSVNEAFSLTGDNNKVSFTDKNGKRMTFNITSLKNEDTQGPYDISRLSQEGTIDVNVCVGFTTPTGEYCNRCVQDIYDPNTNNCNFCEIRATKDVTIMYKTCTTLDSGISDCNIKSLRLGAGEEAALRKSYEIIYISDTEAIEGYECLNIGTWQTMKCWVVNLSSITNTYREFTGLRYKGREFSFSKIFKRLSGDSPPGPLHCYPVEDMAAEIIRIMPTIVQANGNCLLTQVGYKREHTVASRLLYWGVFTKKTEVEEHKNSMLQIVAPEEIVKDLLLVARTPDVNGGQPGTDDDIYGYFLMEFAPRENFEGYDAEDSILPPSLCN